MPKPEPRTTYKYSEEFKAVADKLSHLQGVSIKDVADSLASPLIFFAVTLIMFGLERVLI